MKGDRLTDTPEFAFAGFELCESEFELRRGARRLQAQPLVLRLLLHLVRNRHRLVRRREILDAVWTEEIVSEASLDRAVSLLRRLLGDDPKRERFVRTVRGVGYRFVAHVDERVCPCLDELQ